MTWRTSQVMKLHSPDDRGDDRGCSGRSGEVNVTGQDIFSCKGYVRSFFGNLPSPVGKLVGLLETFY